MTCATLFSGGGLADVGLRAAGYTPVLAVEWDEAIAGVYAANHGDHVKVSPVEAVDYRPFAGVDLLWASPCCTNASVAKTDGKEGTEDICAALAVCRALEEMRPRFFVLENVGGYQKFASFGRIVQTLWRLGYGVHYDVFNAADYGVPQTRRRLILRATRDSRNVPTLVPTHAEKPGPAELFEECQPARPWVGWYAAIADLIAGLPESRFAEWQRIRLEDECLKTGSMLVQETSTLDLRAFDEPSACICSSDRSGRAKALLINGQNAGRDLSLCDGESRAFAVTNTAKGIPRALLIQGTSTLDTRTGERPSPAVVATVHTKAAVPKALLVSNAKTEFSDGLREADEPAFTSTGEQGGRLRDLLERGRVVAMNARALARFQSVPDTYQLPVKNALAFRVVGNGVPSLFAQRIAESLQVTI